MDFDTLGAFDREGELVAGRAEIEVRRHGRAQDGGPIHVRHPGTHLDAGQGPDQLQVAALLRQRDRFLAGEGGHQVGEDEARHRRIDRERE